MRGWRSEVGVTVMPSVSGMEIQREESGLGRTGKSVLTREYRRVEMEDSSLIA